MSERTDEIAKLGIELARDVVGPVPLGDLVGKARELLALAQPEPTPMRWPIGNHLPEIVQCERADGVTQQWAFFVRGTNYPISIRIGADTKCEAIQEYNRVVRKVAGGVDEAVRADIETMCKVSALNVEI